MDNIIDIILILTLGIVIGWLAKRFNQPAAVWLVLSGVIIGPPVLGWVMPSEFIYRLGELGVVLLLGMAGLHLGLGQLRGAGVQGILVALSGMLLCFIGGFLFTEWWGSPFEESLYVGTILTATSIGVSAQVLHEFGLINNSIGRIIIAAAVIDDVIALYLLAVAHGALTDGLSIGNLATSIGLAAIVLAAVYILCILVTRALIRWLSTSQPLVSLSFTVFLIVAMAVLTQKLGYSSVVGGFFAGLGIGEALPDNVRQRLLQQLTKLVFVLIPFFFVLIGARAEWGVLSDPGMPTLFIGLVVVAISGKVLGGIFGAYSSKGLAQRLLIGVSMVPRGEVALVAAGLGFSQGHISHHVLIALILVVVTVALLGPMLTALLAHQVTRHKTNV